MLAHPTCDPVLQELFDPDLPNSPALWAVLKGDYAGKALVDNRHMPRQCVLRTEAALTYFSCRMAYSFLDEAIAQLRKVGNVWLVWPQRSALHPPEIEQAKIVRRLEFYRYDRQSVTLRNLRKQLPEGYAIQVMDRPLLERCAWRDEMEFYAGSLDRFLAHGMGVCMLREDEIVVEVYASALGKRLAEIGAITQEADRGRGFAPIASAFLIEACEQRGYQAYWSCEADNLASIRVAQKLGFQQERDYTIYEYDPIIR